MTESLGFAARDGTCIASVSRTDTETTLAVVYDDEDRSEVTLRVTSGLLYGSDDEPVYAQDTRIRLTRKDALNLMDILLMVMFDEDLELYSKEEFDRRWHLEGRHRHLGRPHRPGQRLGGGPSERIPGRGPAAGGVRR